MSAKEIWSQISIDTKMACGARDAVYSEEQLALWFRVRGNRKLEKVKVKLNWKDLYDVELIEINKQTWQSKTIDSAEDIYAEDLSKTIYRLVNQ